jgi:O-methyltransferase
VVAGSTSLRVGRTVQWLLRRLGYTLVRNQPTTELPYDMDLEFGHIYRSAINFTMGTMVRMYALYQTVRYVEKHGVAGDFVECGVWKDGSTMVAALSLLSAGSMSRHLWLYDTFAGMTEPGDRDELAEDGWKPLAFWHRVQKRDFNE